MSKSVRPSSPTKASPREGRPRPSELVRLAVVALFFLAAPTAGDIGSCGQEAQDLDATKFFRAKEQIDCLKCFECGFTTLPCERACDLELSQTAFPEGCYPLVHDGEVCLNALDAAGCSEYVSYIADQGATVPTECNFCPLGTRPMSARRADIELEPADPGGEL